jgi:SAM-dependent methyltransferase
MATDDSQMTTASNSTGGGDASRPWTDLASGYEQARAREDSLDRLVEWPAQRDMLGDVTGLSLLDAGCGNGAKIAQLVQDGAVASVGIDISDNFVTEAPPGLELIQGDLSDLAAVQGLAGRSFDRILFLQSFGYANDPVHALKTARANAQRRRVRAADPDPADPIRHRTRRGERNHAR